MAFFLDDDTPRARVTDPVTSHMAADRSAASKHAVREAVVTLVRQEGTLTGSEINRLYNLRADRYGWPLVHFDSPRKRAGELAADGLLTILNVDAPRGTESEYKVAEVSE